MSEWVIVLHPLPPYAWAALLSSALLLWVGGIMLGADYAAGCVPTAVALGILLAVLLNGGMVL